MVLPKSIRHHASGKRIFRLDQPIRQGNAASLFCFARFELQRADDSDGIRRHFLTLLHRVSPVQAVGRSRLGKRAGIGDVDILQRFELLHQPLNLGCQPFGPGSLLSRK